MTQRKQRTRSTDERYDWDMDTLPGADDTFAPEGKSRSQKKRESSALQHRGEELAALSPALQAQLPLTPDLAEALALWRGLKSHEAKRRHLQYIGRLMREVDTEAIRAALADARGDSAAETARLHKLERLRNELLDDEATLHDLAKQYPTLDLQHLRSLRRAALKEKEQGKPPRHYRAIFQLLKDAERDSDNLATD